jgi:hypothetical protein
MRRISTRLVSSSIKYKIRYGPRRALNRPYGSRWSGLPTRRGEDAKSTKANSMIAGTIRGEMRCKSHLAVAVMKTSWVTGHGSRH